MVLSQVHSQGVLSEMEQPELELASLWDAGKAGSGFVHCFKVPAQTFLYLMVAILVDVNWYHIVV